MPPEAHGGLSLLELRQAGIDPAGLIDFSVNLNPYGPSPRVREALAAFDPARYPDRDVPDLRAALAEANGATFASVLPGNGTAELIWLAAHAFLQAGDPVLIVGPTFGEYERAARAVGAQVSAMSAAPPDFRLEAQQIAAEIRLRCPRLAFLCNPNNPTGLRLAEAEVRLIAEACGGGLLLLDEAYRGFVTTSPFAPPAAANVVVLRSMTKDFGLAGLRLGYALGAPRWLEAMRAFQPPWSVSGAAQAAGLAALGDMDYLERTLRLTRQAAGALRADLAEAGASIVASSAHYLLIEVGNGSEQRRRLMERGCLVRDCASFGLPRYVRAGARRPEENKRLVEAWRAGVEPQMNTDGRGQKQVMI